MPARRVGRQLRLVPALLVPTARAVAWWPPLAAFTVSLGLLALAVRPGSVLEAEELVQWLRIAIVTGALGWAFLLDDPSEPTTEGVAGSLLLRRALRVALLLPLTTAWWVAVVWRIRAVYPTVSLPIAAFTLEAAALLAVTMALAAPALLALSSAAFLLPAKVTLYAQPGSAAWDGAHQRWALLLGLALVAFAAASRDPAHRRLPSWLRGLTHWLTRGRDARAEAGGSGSPDAAGRVERSVGRGVRDHGDRGELRHGPKTISR